MNVGSEQHSQTGDFSRPVLVFRKWSHEVFWGIPLTTKIRALDCRRLLRKITLLPEIEFVALTDLVIHYLDRKTEPAQSAGSSEAEATV